MSPTTFLSGSIDRTIKLWDINHDEPIRTFRGHTHPTWCVCVKCHQQHFSPEFMTIPSNCGTSTTTNPSAHFVGIHILCAVCVKCHQKYFFPEVMTASSSCGTSTTTKPSAHFVVIVVVCSVCQMSPTTFLSGSGYEPIKLWDINHDEPIRRFRGHTHMVTSVCQMSLTTFLSGSIDKTIKLWDINHDEPIRTFRGHTHEVRSVSNVTNNISLRKS